MELLPILIVLGIFIYFIVKRNVASITRTPIWLFWLVMMTPAFIWTAWILVFADKPPPTLLIIAPFIVCPLLYWWLIQIGRPQSEAKETAVQSQGGEPNPEKIERSPESSPAVRPITPSEEATLRNCFPWNLYYLQHIDYRPQAILCRGKLRSVPEQAYETIKQNIEQVFGDRFLLVFQDSFQGQPFFALVPNPWSKTQQRSDGEKLTRPYFALGLMLITLMTTTLMWVQMDGHTAEQLQADGSLLLQALPYSLGLITILGIHELSHYLAAVYYKIRTTLPYFIPVPFFLGTLGAFIQMRSPVPHRKALFDVAIAGPLGGFLVALPIVIWGLNLSEIVPIAKDSSILSFDALDPRFSFLFALLGKLALGDRLAAGMAIHLHPLAVAGYVGLIVTALNLMPVGQLDGGHIVHAMYGQRTAAIIGQFTRLAVLFLATIRHDFFLWAIILFLMPVIDQPALNDVTELDGKRDFLGLASLILLLAILLPLPGAVAAWLNL